MGDSGVTICRGVGEGHRFELCLRISRITYPPNSQTLSLPDSLKQVFYNTQLLSVKQPINKALRRDGDNDGKYVPPGDSRGSGRAGAERSSDEGECCSLSTHRGVGGALLQNGQNETGPRPPDPREDAARRLPAGGNCPGLLKNLVEGRTR